MWPKYTRDTAGYYTVFGQVDAENAFGAKLRNNYMLVMKSTCSRDHYYRDCWDVYTAVLGDQVIVDRKIPTVSRSYNDNNSDAVAKAERTPTSVEFTKTIDGVLSRYGSSKTVHIIELQKLLASAGYDPGPLDGAMGPRTRVAIEEYQRDHGLPVDGEPSRDLRDRLRNN